MIPNGERWYYLAVKNLLALLKIINFKHKAEFYYLDCLNSFRTKNKLESYKRVYKNEDLCNKIMPSNIIIPKILEFN